MCRHRVSDEFRRFAGLNPDDAYTKWHESLIKAVGNGRDEAGLARSHTSDDGDDALRAFDALVQREIDIRRPKRRVGDVFLRKQIETSPTSEKRTPGPAFQANRASVHRLAQRATGRTGTATCREPNRRGTGRSARTAYGLPVLPARRPPSESAYARDLRDAALQPVHHHPVEE
jgi:hypothetical protein